MSSPLEDSELLERTAKHFLGMRRMAGMSDEFARAQMMAIVAAAARAESELLAPAELSQEHLVPMGTAALRGIAGRFVKLVEPHTESDPAGLLVQLLAGVGTLLGRGAHARVEDDLHYGNLFVLLTGRTAHGRKGTSWRRVQALLALVDPAWAKRGIEQGGLSSGEGLVWGVKDSTDEGSATSVADKRQLVFEGEFASVLKVLSRDGNTLSPLLRNAWDVGTLTIKTKNSPCRATGAHLSIVAHVTRAELLRRLDRAEVAGGLFNRFLIVAVGRSKLLPHGGKLPAEPLKELARDLSAAVKFGRVEREIGFDDAARALWEQLYPLLSGARCGLYGDATARAEAQVLRLALIYAVLDCSSVITTEHLRAAVAVWDYCDRSARYVFGDRLDDPLSESVLAHLKLEGRWTSRSDIVNGLSRHAAGARLQGALEELTTAGLIEMREEPTAGRPRAEYRARSVARSSLMELCSLFSPLLPTTDAAPSETPVPPPAPSEPP